MVSWCRLLADGETCHLAVRKSLIPRQMPQSIHLYQIDAVDGTLTKETVDNGQVEDQNHAYQLHFH